MKALAGLSLTFPHSGPRGIPALTPLGPDPRSDPTLLLVVSGLRTVLFACINVTVLLLVCDGDNVGYI